MNSSTEIIGYYSVTKNREYVEGASSLRCFVEPKLPIDLKKGINDVIWSQQFRLEGMEHILTFIVKNKHALLSRTGSEDSGDRLIPCSQFITSRGVLRRVILRRTKELVLLATKFEGNIYLSIKQTEKDGAAYSVGGLIFIQHCLLDCLNTSCGESKVFDEAEQFFCVFKTQLVGRGFLFSSDIKAYDSQTPLDLENPKKWKPNQFVMVKQNIELSTSQREYNFQHFVAPLLWTQCYLSGIERVYLGFKHEDEVARRARWYSMNQLEQIFERNWPMEGRFDPLESFLRKVETDLKDIDNCSTTLCYAYDDNTGEWISAVHTECLLPDWYIEEMKKTM